MTLSPLQGMLAEEQHRWQPELLLHLIRWQSCHMDYCQGGYSNLIHLWCCACMHVVSCLGHRMSYSLRTPLFSLFQGAHYRELRAPTILPLVSRTFGLQEPVVVRCGSVIPVYTSSCIHFMTAYLENNNNILVLGQHTAGLLPHLCQLASRMNITAYISPLLV